MLMWDSPLYAVNVLLLLVNKEVALVLMWYSKAAHIVLVSKYGERNTSSVAFSVSTFIQCPFDPWNSNVQVYRESLPCKHIRKNPYRDVLYRSPRHFVTNLIED